MKILLADDNEENLYMLGALVRGEGHEVLSARNGLEALGLLKSSGADLIISDILMPGMDGFQLCRAVRGDEDLRHIPFVFYTATYISDKDRDFALSIGADQYFVKPDDIESLVQTIKEAVAVHTSPVEHPLGDEMEFFRQHNKVLFRKLEKKVCDLEKAKQKIQASLQQMSAILNNIPDIAWLKDTESRFIAVNSPFGEACGHKPQDLVGKTDPDIWPQDLADLYRRDDREVMTTRQQKRVEERLVGPDGKESWIETIKTPVFDLDGNVIGTTGIARDITERKQIEEEKALLEAQLRQSQKMEAIGQLAGGVAHDFNNILSAIVGYSSLAMTNMKSGDPNRHYIEQILESANRATILTQSLLAFGRKQPINLKRIDLNEMVRNFEKFLVRLLRENIELAVNIAEEALPVIADRGQIEQVLMNLLTNARDAMPNGGRVVIGTRPLEIDSEFVKFHGFGEPGHYAVLTVTDTGTGIPDEIRRKIFDPFFTTKEQGKGTGLGLSMVYGIVVKHQGYIDVYSDQGRGTTFKIYLPLAHAADLHEEEKTEELLPPLRGGSETILISEDDAALRDLAVTMLRHYGYTVIEAADGIDAVARFVENRDRIRLVILDAIMPKLGGKDAWMEMRALNPDIKVIFISGYAEDMFAKAGVPQEGAVFLQKPIPPSALVRKIREMLDT